MDKSEIIAILNDWNYWDRVLPDTKERPFYDTKINTYLQYDEVVVIKGIRRSGKSTLMINQIKQLIKEEHRYKKYTLCKLGRSKIY